jgi:hypothetical protein
VTPLPVIAAVPFRPYIFKGGNCSLAININYVEADTSHEVDVGCPMILEPPLDHLSIDRDVARSMAAIPRQDKRGARDQRKDEKALVCVAKCCREMVDASTWL